MRVEVEEAKDMSGVKDTDEVDDLDIKEVRINLDFSYVRKDRRCRVYVMEDFFTAQVSVYTFLFVSACFCLSLHLCIHVYYVCLFLNILLNKRIPKIALSCIYGLWKSCFSLKTTHKKQIICILCTVI